MGEIGLIQTILQVKSYSFKTLCFTFVQSFKGLSSVLIRLVCSCITWQHQDGVVMFLFSSRCLSSTGDRAKETHKFILKYFSGCVRASVSCQPPSHFQCSGCACSLAHTSADSSSLISFIPSIHWLAGTYVCLSGNIIH